MPDAIVVGAGPTGLTAAISLARAGLSVEVLERSPEPSPADPQAAWDSWDRRPVAQFRQAHILLPKGHLELQRHLPEVTDRLLEAGAVTYDVSATRPSTITDWVDEPEDARFTTVTARRPVIDWAFSGLAADTAGLDVRRGAAVEALISEAAAGGRQRITGVRTGDGAELSAQVVLDASGRRTAIPELLADAGSGPGELVEESGFAYYTRFYQSADGSLPERLGGLLSPVGSISVLTLPGDNGSWSVTLYSSSEDRAMRAVRDPEVFERVVAACPLHAQWLDGEPISDVGSMTSVVDRRYDYLSEGEPVATGLIAVGDAWACTNPSVGRGISMGIAHGVDASRLVAEHLADPDELARAFWKTTASEHQPWHDATLQTDRLRQADIETFRAGGVARTDPDDPVAALTAAFPVAAFTSAELFRAFLEIVSALTLPLEVLGRTGVADQIMAVAGGADPPQLPGPSRDQLEALLV